MSSLGMSSHGTAFSITDRLIGAQGVYGLPRVTAYFSSAFMRPEYYTKHGYYTTVTMIEDK